MIKLYKKENNKKVDINSLEELDNPFIICLDDTDSVINTTITNDNTKVDLIGIDYNAEKTKSKTQEIVDRVIIPYILEKDGILDRTNKLNFISVGNGTATYQMFEKDLIERLEKMNYSQEKINKIVSKLTLISVLSMVDTSSLYSHTISFVDVNNNTIKNNITEEYKKALISARKSDFFGTYGKQNNILYIHIGTGNNDYNEYLEDTSFTSIVSYVLEKTINNEEKSVDEMLKILSESKRKNINDIPFKFTAINKSMEEHDAILMERLYRSEINIRKRREEELERIIDSIKTYSSDITYQQILMATGLEEYDEEIMKMESDKKVRAFYDEIMEEVDEELKNNTKR